MGMPVKKAMGIRPKVGKVSSVGAMSGRLPGRNPGGNDTAQTRGGPYGGTPADRMRKK
jgi:hypothetical protein